MTAHKHFKALVRARMSKTGESYTTARRHVIRDAPLAAPSTPAGWHLPGSVPATTALRVLLTAAGIRDPRDGQPLSEALLFGIAGGVGMGVMQFVYEKEDFASFFVAGRHLWHDDEAYLTAALERLGLRPHVAESGGAKAARKQLSDAVGDGADRRPCVAWIDMGSMPHRGMPERYRGGGYHVVTVYEVDEAKNEALVGDLTDAPIAISLDDLTLARARIKKFKNRVLWIDAARAAARTPALAPLVRAGVAACVEGLAARPMRGYPTGFNLDGVAAWAQRLHGGADKDAWPRAFARGGRLWQGLSSVNEYIEHYFTGGGLCRGIFAEFLGEAGRVLGDPRWAAAAERYAALANTWSAVADAALPRGVPLFDELRALRVERGEMLAEGDAANTAALRDVWAKIDALGERAKSDFPLDAAACDALLRSLQQQVAALHADEVSARDDLIALAA